MIDEMRWHDFLAFVFIIDPLSAPSPFVLSVLYPIRLRTMLFFPPSISISVYICFLVIIYPYLLFYHFAFLLSEEIYISTIPKANVVCHSQLLLDVYFLTLIGGYLPMLQRYHFFCCTTEPFNGIFVFCNISLIRTHAWSCNFESRGDNWSSQSVWLGWYCLDSRSHRQAIQLTLMLWLRSWTDIPSLSLLSFSIYTLCFSAHFDSYTLCYLLGYVVYTFVSPALFLFTICFLPGYLFVYALCFSTIWRNIRSSHPK